MPTNTRIIFGTGVEVTVDKEPAEVRRLLSADRLEHKEPFTQFKEAFSGKLLYVAAEAVVYFEDVPN